MNFTRSEEIKGQTIKCAEMAITVKCAHGRTRAEGALEGSVMANTEKQLIQSVKTSSSQISSAQWGLQVRTHKQLRVSDGPYSHPEAPGVLLLCVWPAYQQFIMYKVGDHNWMNLAAIYR